MKQGQKIDTIKLYLDLISKLKKREQITLSNKLLNTELKNITNKQIRLMVDIQAMHHDTRTPEEIQQILNKIVQLKNTCKINSSEIKIYDKLRLKVHAVALGKALNENREEQVSKHKSALLQNITSIEQHRFVLQVMFQLNNLTLLLEANPEKIMEKYKGEKGLHNALFIIAMIKATTNPEEAVKILKNINQNPSIINQRKPFISFLGEMIKKQKNLLSYRGVDESLQRSFLPIDKSTLKVIKNSIQAECKIPINESNPLQTFSRISTSEQNIYLHAFPLVHFYFEKNAEVIQSVKNTELYKYLITAKSFLVENYLNNSYASNITHSRIKSKIKNKKNPYAYQTYLKNDINACKDICVEKCRKGYLFIKHNYGNLKYSSKFVRITGETLQYFKDSEATGSGTKWDFSDILCIVYGKSTSRQQENESDPQICFSVVMKDRTLDLSVESIDQLNNMFSFMRGFSFLLNQYHQRERNKIEEELQGLKDKEKKSRQKELNQKIQFHEGKHQKLTKGHLLWSQLLRSLNKNIKPSQSGKFEKAEGLKQFVSNILIRP